MRTILFFFLTLFVSLTVSFAQSTPSYWPGDSAYIWASSGLKLRSAPGLQSRTIKILPYGTKVHIRDVGFEQLQTHVERIESGFCGQGKTGEHYAFSGHWLPVRVGKTNGYVFGGYLLKNAPPKRHRLGYVSESLHQYAERVFGSPTILLEQSPHETYAHDEVHTRYSYPNGALYEASGVFDFTERLVLPSSSMREAYLLLNMLMGFEAHYFADSEELRKFASFCYTGGILRMGVDLAFAEVLVRGDLVLITKTISD